MSHVIVQRLLAIGAMCGIVLIGAATTNAAGVKFFDDSGTGCDLYNAATSLTDGVLSPWCGTETEGVRLWVGETAAVQTLVEGEPMVKARAYFKDLPVSSGRIVNPTAISAGRAVMVVKGANLCPTGGFTGPNSLDAVVNGFFAVAANYNNTSLIYDGMALTRYTFGNESIAGTIQGLGVLRKLNSNCGTNTTPTTGNEIRVDLRNLPAAHIVPVPGIDKLWYVDITVRHIDRSVPISDPDGLRNGFNLILEDSLGTNTYLHRITSAGTNATLGGGVRTTDGYVATFKRAPTTTGIEDDGKFVSFRAQFGSDCTVTARTLAEATVYHRIILYDADSPDVPELEGLRLRVRDDTSSMYLALPAGAPGAVYEDALTGAYSPTATSYIRVTGEWFPASNYSGGVQSFGESFNIPSSNLKYYSILFKAVRNHSYTVELMNSRQVLVNQYGLPFDSVYYQNGCDAVATSTSTIAPSPVVEAGATASAGGTVQNGVDTARLNVSRRYWYDLNNNSIFDAGDNSIAYVAPAPITLNPGASNTATTLTHVANSSIGTRICHLLTVTNQAGDTTIIDNGPAACTTIAKYPAFRVTRSDLRAGGAPSVNPTQACQLAAFDTTGARYLLRGRDYVTQLKGSYVDYGVRSAGRIQYVGSNGLYFSGDDTTSARLLFGSADWLAAYGIGNNGFFLGTASPSPSTHCLPAVHRLYTPPPSFTAINSSTANFHTSEGFTFNGTGNTLTIGNGMAGANLGLGERKVIWVRQATGSSNNKVIINTNIRHPATYTDRAAIPQFTLIIDGDIDLEFDDGVTEVNALIYTRGNVRTCNGYNGSQNLTLNICNNTLLLRGALVAEKRVYPYRTAGFTTAADRTYAETFELSPELLINEYLRASSSPSIRTTYQTELPPRL